MNALIVIVALLLIGIIGKSYAKARRPKGETKKPMLKVRWVGIIDVRTGDGWVVPACESPNTVNTVGLDIRVEWHGAEVIFTGETSPNHPALQFRMQANEQRSLLSDLLIAVTRDYSQASAWLETQRGLTPAGLPAVA